MSEFDYEDRLTISTPEGVELQLTLAGVGSRFVAALVDLLIELAALLVFGLLVALTDGFGTGPDGAEALIGVVAFAVFWGYDVGFEVLAGGRTPGKRSSGLRVVLEGGQPITFSASAVRNLMRLVDFLPTFYLVGIVSILVSAQNQRLGDLVAGAVVVRETDGDNRPLAAFAPEARGGAEPSWDVTAITAEELAAVNQFLARRLTIDFAARHELASVLAARLRAKTAGVPEQLQDEAFLEALARAKAQRPSSSDR
jgi:uncharacterized RDD family membrane protein YckC